MAANRKASQELSTRQLAELRDNLERERDGLASAGRMAGLEEIMQERQSGGDEADESSDENLNTNLLRFRDRDRGKLMKVLKALKRVEEGSYNECESCGAPIGYPRLKARPFTTLCIVCKEEQEQEERQKQDNSRAAKSFVRY